MQTARIGHWQFLMPEDFEQKDRGSGANYFESPDGTKGLYVKLIDFGTPRESPEAVASHVQIIHESSFFNLENSSWRVIDRRTESRGAFIKSALDIYDSSARYRVLSIVMSDKQTAIQITLHDYICEDYASRKELFNAIELSIERSTTNLH